MWWVTLLHIYHLICWWKKIKIGEHLAKLQAKWLTVSYTQFALHFCPQRCRSRQLNNLCITDINCYWAKQALNDKLQGSVAAYLSCGGVVHNQIKKYLLLSVWVIFFKSVKIWQSYQQERDCVVHFLSSFSSVLARRTKCMRQPRSCL